MKAKLLFPVLLLLIGCNVSNQPLTERQRDAVMKEATPVVKEFFDALISNDTVKLMALIDKAPETTIVNTMGVFSYDDLKKIVPQFFSMVEKQSFETKTEKYTVVDRSCFTYTWYGKNIVFIKGAEPAVYDDLLGSYTFKKTGNSWKITHMHESVMIPGVADPQKEFTKIEEDWLSAVFNKDSLALDKLYAKEYVYISPKGYTNNKQQDINEVIGPTYKVLAPFKLSDIKVNMYGTVAVVTGVATSKATLNGKDISGSNRFVDIFTYRDGRWQCVLSQAIPAQKK